jgi:CHASE2 domain-containing sensor protein
MTQEPIQLFFSYSHKDEELRDELALHLTTLKRQGVIKVWHDREISAGTQWADAIDENLNSADVILLLISANFLASDYCYDLEMQTAMRRHEAGEACVIPIILKPVDWSGAPFSKLQALPKNAKPVTTWEHQDEAFLDIVQNLRKVAEKIAVNRSNPNPKNSIELRGDKGIIKPEAWQQLRNRQEKTRETSAVRFPLLRVLFLSLVATLLTMGLRWLGILQPLELKAFDHLLHLRLPESPDSRLLIVGADEQDISKYGYPLPNEVLKQLLEKLKSREPAAIGIDIFRDQPAAKDKAATHQEFIRYLKKNEKVVTICAVGTDLTNSVAPPPQMTEEQVGFVDLYDDRQPTQGKDNTVRRYLLSRSPNLLESASQCRSPYSLAWHLAYRYLKAQGIPVIVNGENWQFGSVVVKPLENRSGGYQTLDARGNQLLINYHHTPQIARQLTIRDVLEEKADFNPAWVKNRVVLIGVTAASVPDTHDTPYGEIRGIYIHAHVISQILSAVSRENRSLFWWLPQWGDAIFVFGWSLVGGLVLWYGNRLSVSVQGLAVGVVAIALYGSCWLVFLWEGWLPLVPSAFGLGLTAASVKILSRLELGF